MSLQSFSWACLGPWLGTYKGRNGTYGMDLTHIPIRVPGYPWYGPDPYTHTGPWVPMVMCFGRLLPMTHLPYRLGHGNAPKTEKLPK
jgi:hypothetical protein